MCECFFPTSSLQTNHIVLRETQFSQLADTPNVGRTTLDELHTGEFRLVEWEKTNGTQQMVICMIPFHTFPEDRVGHGRLMQG